MSDRNAAEGGSKPKGMASLYDYVEREVDAVSARLKSELDKWPLIDYLMRLLSSMVFFASQRLIDRKGRTEEVRIRDEAIILSCPRLFSDSFAGYLLLRKGLILQAITLLRSAFEVTTQAMLFFEKEDMAEKWLEGRRIKPREVRELTSMPEQERKLYERLANLAHPNYHAIRYYVAPVVREGMPGSANVYGGWFAPKDAGQIALQFLWAQLTFLEGFYKTYSDDLSEHDLLWRLETVQEVFGGTTLPEDFSMQQYLALLRDLLTKLGEDHAQKTPEDIVEIALAMSDYTPEQREQFRQGFQDQVAKFATASESSHGSAP